MGYKKSIQLLKVVVEDYKIDKELKMKINEEIRKYEDKHGVTVEY